jgi:Transmembrane secretion effector
MPARLGLEQVMVDGLGRWRAWQDSNEPCRILEQFVVASWQDHLLQHAHVTRRDQQRYDAIRAMTDPAHPAAVTPWLTPLPATPTGA